jgi:hypothetical protein
MRGDIQTILFLLLLPFVHAANVTVDDANPLWKYSAAVGSTGWGELYPGHMCSFCLSQPDPTRAHNRTWHDTDRANSASLTFLGIAITVYGICPGPLPLGAVYVTNYSFTLDGQSAGTYNGTGCAALTYDWPFFSQGGLSPGSHTFTVTNAPAPADSMVPRSDLLLDYAVYDDGGLVSSTAAAPTRSVATLSTATETSNTEASSAASSGERPRWGLPGTPALVGVVLSSFIVLATTVVGIML